MRENFSSFFLAPGSSSLQACADFASCLTSEYYTWMHVPYFSVVSHILIFSFFVFFVFFLGFVGFYFCSFLGFIFLKFLFFFLLVDFNYVLHQSSSGEVFTYLSYSPTQIYLELRRFELSSSRLYVIRPQKNTYGKIKIKFKLFYSS